jgi:hypothetical protein
MVVALLVLPLFVGVAWLIGFAILRWPAEALLGFIGVPLILALVVAFFNMIIEIVVVFIKIVACVVLAAWSAATFLLRPFARRG